MNRKFNVYWTTGFTVRVLKRTLYKVGWVVQLTFIIKLHKKYRILKESKNLL